MHLPLVDSEQQHQPQKREEKVFKKMGKENKSKRQAGWWHPLTSLVKPEQWLGSLSGIWRLVGRNLPNMLTSPKP